MTAAETIPLFPLRAVLLPYGRIPLRIFEQRYLQLVSECFKTGTGFGVVWLNQGHEVLPDQSQKMPTIEEEKLSQVGTYARIVDWDALPSGLLGITIEGEKKFRLLSSRKQQNQQYIAEIQWIEQDSFVALPDEAQELQGLLEQLLEHPHVERLNVNSNIEDVGHLAYLLTQLLPIDERAKFQLLVVADPLQRFGQLMELLDNLSQ